METKRLVKLIVIIFLAWLFVTYVPNTMLHKWYFILFTFADFYVAAHYMKKRSRGDLFLNTVIVGLLVLGVASLILNRLGF